MKIKELIEKLHTLPQEGNVVFIAGLHIYGEIKYIGPDAGTGKQEDREANVKHGHWVLKGNGNADCSICGYRSTRVYDDDNADRYCRHCGAKMVEDCDEKV